MLYLKSIPEAPATSSSSSEETSSDEAVQAEIIYYDKIWFEEEILNYTDVILPLSSNNPDYLTKTVFVGDSNTEGLANFNHMPSSNVLGKHSMGIAGFSKDKFRLVAEDNPETEEDESLYITMLTALSYLQPKRIIINFGTNNAGKYASVSSFIDSYSNALSLIKTNCPNTQIVVASVLPVCFERDNLNIRQNIIDEFNIELAELCRQQGIGFLNYSEVFKDAETGYADADYFSVDGIHLNGKGFRLLLDYVTNHQYN